MRKSVSLYVILLAGLAAPLSAQKKDAPAPPASVLPADFSGWYKTVPYKEAVPRLHGDVMEEYGLVKAESFEYRRGDRRIAVTALRFKDATGAYGAFTFYRTPEM